MIVISLQIQLATQRKVVALRVHFNVEAQGIASVGSSFAMAVRIALTVPTRSVPRVAVLLKHLNAQKVAFACPEQGFVMETEIVRTTRMKRIATIDEVSYISISIHVLPFPDRFQNESFYTSLRQSVPRDHSDVTMANVYRHTSSAMR